MTVVRMGRTKKMMKMQSTTSLRYLASRVDGGQDDVVFPVGRLHPGTLQGGSVRVEEVSRFPIQLLGRPSLGPPPHGPWGYATAISSFGAVDQQPAGGGGTVVGWERRHSWGGFAGPNIWSTPASGGWGGIIVWGGLLVGGPMDEALEMGFSWRACAPHHQDDFIYTVSTTRKTNKECLGILYMYFVNLKICQSAMYCICK